MLTGIAPIEARVLGGARAARWHEGVRKPSAAGYLSNMVATAPRGLELRAASLFDVDPELGELVDARHLAAARQRAIVAVAELPAGAWSPEVLDRVPGRPFAIMVVEGLVLRELLLAGSTATELLGPGDIVDHRAAEDALLPAEARWSVPEAARIAILDDRLLAILRPWPGVGRILLDRLARRELRLSTHRAIAQLPRVDERLLAFFGHLAERWGRVGAPGVIVPMQLTHETLGRLIGARRPTVSLALKEMAANHLLERRNDGSWLLRYEALERLGAETAIPQGWQPAEAHPIGTPEGMPEASNERFTGALSREDIQALRTRVDRLREQHARRMSRCAAVLERSRTTRLALRRSRDGGYVP
jgi:CRP/FNR family transcriptional regulator, cyclic AMP receptor protein